MKSEAVALRKLVVLGIVSLVLLAGCGGGTSQSLNNQPPSGSNPTPTITTISPKGAAAGGTAFTLTINGTNFVAASMVNFGGTAPATTFVNSTQLTAAIPAAAIAQAGTAFVRVTNPTPGGGTSNAVNFTITSGTNPAPTINSLSPSCAPVGGHAFTLLVFGSNFVDSSVVRWNGSDRPTTLSTSTLLAQIPASDIAAAGTAAVTVFNPGGGSSNTSTVTIATGGVSPRSVAVDPTGKFAYAANAGCADAFVGNVSMYTINPTTGALSSMGTTAAGLSPTSIAIHPSSKFAYVANENDPEFLAGNVSMYTINPTTGALTSIGSPVAADFGSHSISVDPFGKFAYVANDGGFDVTAGSVFMYTINAATGALAFIGAIAAPCAPPPSPGSCAPFSVAVDPSGKFAYVANEGGFIPTSVSMYTINATTGALTSLGTIAAGGRAISVAVDPTGKFAYVANGGDGLAGSVSMYTINATTGALMSTGTIAAGLSPTSIAIDPSGKFSYVTNSGSNDVSMYTINATTGGLSSIGTIAAGLSPSSIAIHPSGKFAYVSNFGSNNVSMYSIDAASGALTLIGTIAT